MALTLGIVGIGVVNRMDDYFLRQTQVDLADRRAAVIQVVANSVERASDDRLVVSPSNVVNPAVIALLSNQASQTLLADGIAQANLVITFGQITVDSSGSKTLVPAVNGRFIMARQSPPRSGQAPDPITTDSQSPVEEDRGALGEYALTVTLSEPYTFRASAVANVIGLIAIVGLVALTFAVAIAALVAGRFTAPLRRLTEASQAIATGDYTRRVPANLGRTGAAEIAELSRQFNAMAAQLGESVDIIRRDRDRSRDFLADVSHELRTPIAAMRTFNELLREGASDDPEARDEFLESSRQQLERLDWLAQNLLDLSKLDSGLVLLDLRADDLRACVEAAVEQAEPVAARRGLQLGLDLTPEPIEIRHDAQRIGQVVTNLIGNALKFTPRGGRVDVRVRPSPDGAQIEVRDTGVGIDASELPRIFDRFYRGSRANEARGSGSGLGLAIVKSIVDMHGGRIAVESLIGGGSTFTVTIPEEGVLPPVAAGSESATSADSVSETPVPDDAWAPPDRPTAPDEPLDRSSNVADSSPSQDPSLNQGLSG